MKKEKENIITIILGALAITVIIVQIATINPKSTKLEVALLNILQFIFSIGFSWFLAKVTFKLQFIESQKKFGIAAYRRITEIDKRVSQLIDKIYEKTITPSKDNKIDLEVFVVITNGIKQSINSCIADWGDIIGDELDALEEINKLSKERERLLSDNRGEGHIDNNDIGNDIHSMPESNNQIEDYNKRISELMSLLPDTIKVQVQESRRNESIMNKQERTKKNIEKISKIISEIGYVQVDGFWDYSYERDIRDFKIGDRLNVYIEENGNRKETINVFDNNGKKVGRITNSFACPYTEFSTMLADYFGNEVFFIEITEIDSEVHNNKRVYFKGILTEKNNENVAC